jgi:tyrosyl-tRNA synthetase
VTDGKPAPIPAEILAEARELSRGAEVLPDGAEGLARKIMEVGAQGRKLRVKLGVDPTHTDLHIGHAVQFRALKRFQDLGHQVVLIIGGFTAQIGDPSGRNKTRPTLTREETEANAKTYLEQIGLILDLDKIELTNNADWLAPLGLDQVLKLAAKTTVNQMLQKEAFGDRLDKQQPIGLHELFYPILQGYDSVAIKSDIELGGTDQRFNILQGRELQMRFDMDAQLACLLPLLEGTDGVQKMSKTYDNYIGLKENPTDMYGKSMRVPDALLVKYFELATSLKGADVEEIKEQLESGENPMNLKHKLAHQIVLQYHGAEAAGKAQDEWKRVHSERKAPEDMPSYSVPEDMQLFKVLVHSNLAGGSGEAKRLIQEGGVRAGGEQCKDPNTIVTPDSAASFVLQVGRRRFVKIEGKLQP